MTEAPLISVIIPVYNACKRLVYLIDSLKKQIYRNLEIVIYDDGSTDNLQEFLGSQRLDSFFAHVQIIHCQVNMGVSFARNKGFDASKGDYIVFVDADDLLEPQFISRLYETISVNKADYASCAYKDLFLNTNVIKPEPVYLPAKATPENILVSWILGKYKPAHFTFLYSRRFLIENHLRYTEGCRVSEDIEFMMKVCATYGRGAFIDDMLYIYVLHDDMGSHDVQDHTKRVRRYRDHTFADVRMALYLIKSTNSKRAKFLAQYFLLPAACQRIFSLCAMDGRRERFDRLLQSSFHRSVLLSSWRTFLYKPVVFIRSLFLLCMPSAYWSKYTRY